MLIAVVAIVLALVFYLLSTIVALRQITAGLDDAIGDVTGIVEKSAPVNDIVAAINEQLDAGVDLLEGLLVKKAGLVDAISLVDSLYPGAAAAGSNDLDAAALLVTTRDQVAETVAGVANYGGSLDVILGALPGIARKAAIVADRRPR